MLFQPGFGGGGERAGRFAIGVERGEMARPALKPARVAAGRLPQGVGGPPVHGVNHVRDGRVEDRLADDRVSEGDDTAGRLQQTDPDAVRQGLCDLDIVSCRDRVHERRLEVAHDRAGDDHLALGAAQAFEAGFDELAGRPGHA